jgi:protein gp37
MIKYSQLTEKPKQFLAVTGLTVDEFEWILPVFREKLAGLHPPELTKRGTLWQRRARVPFFFKPWGGMDKKRAGRALEGRTWAEMPIGMMAG